MWLGHRSACCPSLSTQDRLPYCVLSNQHDRGQNLDKPYSGSDGVTWCPGQALVLVLVLVLVLS
jgi:hypothetical protein